MGRDDVPGVWRRAGLAGPQAKRERREQCFATASSSNGQPAGYLGMTHLQLGKTERMIIGRVAGMLGHPQRHAQRLQVGLEGFPAAHGTVVDRLTHL